jgi:hypothetical protein
MEYYIDCSRKTTTYLPSDCLLVFHSYTTDEQPTIAKKRAKALERYFAPTHLQVRLPILCGIGRTFGAVSKACLSVNSAEEK